MPPRGTNTSYSLSRIFPRVFTYDVTLFLFRNSIHGRSCFDHGILLGPFLCIRIELCSVIFVDPGDVSDQRIVRIWIRQQRLNWHEYFGGSQCGRPLSLKNIQADGTVGVHVRMIDLCCELELRWLEWVVLRKIDAQRKITILIRRVRWARDSGLPFVRIVGVDWTTRYTLGGRLIDVLQLFKNSTHGCHWFVCCFWFFYFWIINQ